MFWESHNNLKALKIIVLIKIQQKRMKDYKSNFLKTKKWAKVLLEMIKLKMKNNKH